MSFVEKVARIRNELLGAPSDMPPPKVVVAAMPLMGIVPEPSWALPQMGQSRRWRRRQVMCRPDV